MVVIHHLLAVVGIVVALQLGDAGLHELSAGVSDAALVFPESASDCFSGLITHGHRMSSQWPRSCGLSSACSAAPFALFLIALAFEGAAFSI